MIPVPKAATARKRFLLVYPGALYAPKWGRSLALKTHLVYLHAYLEQFFDVSVVDLQIELPRPRDSDEVAAFTEDAIARVTRKRFDYVGLSCWTSMEYLASRLIAEAVKARHPQTTVIVGGWHAICAPEDFEYPGTPFDHVVRGKVEQLPSALGLAPRQPFIRKHLELSRYPYYDGHGTVGLFISTGCPFTCSFCMEYDHRWHPIPAREAADLVAQVDRDYSPAMICFYDALFGFKRSWRREFLRALIERGIQAVLWAESRCDLWEREDFELMAELDFLLEFGVESFSEKMIRIMNKSHKPARYLDQFCRASQTCSELGIMHGAFLINNHPGECEETVAEHVELFNRRIVPELRGGHLRLSGQGYAFYPGSPVQLNLAHYEREYGTTIEHPHWWRMEGNHSVLSRAVVASRDGDGRAYRTPAADLRALIDDFNGHTRDLERIHELKSFEVGNEPGPGPAPARPEHALTSPEIELLALLDRRLYPKQIAQSLSVPYATVHERLEHVYRKLEVRDRRRAVEKGHAMNLLAPH